MWTFVEQWTGTAWIVAFALSFVIGIFNPAALRSATLADSWLLLLVWLPVFLGMIIVWIRKFARIGKKSGWVRLYSMIGLTAGVAAAFAVIEILLKDTGASKWRLEFAGAFGGAFVGEFVGGLWAERHPEK